MAFLRAQLQLFHALNVSPNPFVQRVDLVTRATEETTPQQQRNLESDHGEHDRLADEPEQIRVEVHQEQEHAERGDSADQQIRQMLGALNHRLHIGGDGGDQARTTYLLQLFERRAQDRVVVLPAQLRGGIDGHPRKQQLRVGSRHDDHDAREEEQGRESKMTDLEGEEPDIALVQRWKVATGLEAAHDERNQQRVTNARQDPEQQRQHHFEWCLVDQNVE